MSYRTSLKVLILGDVAVTFSYEYKVTIGVDFLLKELVIDDNIITLQIWDTAGQERYHAFNAPFYRGADCALLVFDITDPLTFEHLDVWLENLTINSQNFNDLQVVVVGNRSDLTNLREVSEITAKTWCDAKNLRYFEVSAKTGENINEIFDFLSQKCLKNLERIRKEDEMNLDRFTLTQPVILHTENNRSCCS